MNDTTVKEVTYPQCERVAEVRPQCEAISDFLNWAEAEGMVLCSMDGALESEIVRGRPQLYADFFGIDRTELEKERRAIILAHQESQTVPA